MPLTLQTTLLQAYAGTRIKRTKFVMTCIAAGTGKTSLLKGRDGIAIDDDSTNTPGQEGLVQLISASLFDLLEEKQLSTGLLPRVVDTFLCCFIPRRACERAVLDTLVETAKRIQQLTKLPSANQSCLAFFLL